MLSEASSKSYSSSMSPDDLLEHVLDRHQAGHAAVLVDHDRHVVAAGAELAQQHVEALRLGHEHRRAQHLAHVEFSSPA
jgi:hypothetical protein